MTVKIGLFLFVLTGLDHSCCCALKALYCITRPELNNYQLMNETEYLMKNYGDRGGCYPSRPRRKTPSEISIILHVIRKSNSIIVLLFIKVIPS